MKSIEIGKQYITSLTSDGANPEPNSVIEITNIIGDVIRYTMVSGTPPLNDSLKFMVYSQMWYDLSEFKSKIIEYEIY